MRAALAELGEPHLQYPVLHVGGTNGKGSVAAMAAWVLGAGGRRVGLYTSPHICSFDERILLNGAPVPEDRIQRYADELRAPLARNRLTFFEAATLLAFQTFARERVDVAVFEVGLGGRLDATNVARPVVTVVTNVARDHTEYLGHTLQSIAAEKAGIAKPGVPFLTAERDADVTRVMADVCSERDAPFEMVGAERLTDVRIAPEGTELVLATKRWGELRLTTPLVGAHQATNAALGVAALEALPSRLRPEADAVVRGIAEVRWAGRNQVRRGVDGTWLFDVAHNPAGTRSLAEVLDRVALPRPFVGLVGILADKEWIDMLVPLCARLERALLTVPESAPAERRWDPLRAAARVRERKADGCVVEAVPDFGRALEAARSAASAGTVVVTGSVNTVGDAMRRLHWCSGLRNASHS